MMDRRIYPKLWEEVQSFPHFYRLQVPGGWLVAVELHEFSSTCFVPDPAHEWMLGK